MKDRNKISAKKKDYDHNSNYINFPSNFTLGEKIFFALVIKYSPFWDKNKDKRKMKKQIEKFLEKILEYDDSMSLENYLTYSKCVGGVLRN
ncbi:MAG: hypothetical protein COU27_03450 [Candidatus Levybacteria bacterium CG10_big_fil_rev_8_21_14_0_10_36_7]|nr:MAG: hypothetical protein COU27_03450 [Candidatus Levybacteria bacterium CG10_big_fil_rev_8_21_14_0_10_36_7]